MIALVTGCEYCGIIIDRPTLAEQDLALDLHEISEHGAQLAE